MTNKEIIKSKYFFFEYKNFLVQRIRLDMNVVNIGNTLVSNKCHVWKKTFEYFAGYLNHSNDCTNPLLIELHKLNKYIKSFVKNIKWNVYNLFLLIKNMKLC